MSSNEEYLDNLLKSMDDDSGSQGANGADEMDDEDIDALFAAAERILNGELAEDEPAGAGVYKTENASEDSAKEPEAEPEVSPEPEEELDVEEPAPFIEEEPVSSVEEQEAYQTVESTKDMSQEEIEALLASTKKQMEEAAEEAAPENAEDAAEADDLMALLGGLDSNEDLNAIGDLLEAADSGALPVAAEVPDTGEAEAFSPDIAYSAGMEEEPAENAEEDGKKGKKKRERKPKKEKKVKEKREKKKKPESVESADAMVAEGEAGATAEQPEKKKGLFSKLLTALTEEEESNVSDENQAIMQELEEEDLKEAGKKKKIKKGKKPAGGKGGSEEDEEGGSAKGKKKAKPKKEPKPKKQKEPKEPKEPEKPGKRISPKSIIVVVLFAATVFGGVFLSISLFSGELRMQSAKDAFDQRDYMTCYEEMYGMDLDEEEEIMFRHAQIVLKMQRRIKIYEEYIGEGRELEALDSLMQAVADYDAMYAKAQECGAGPEVAGLYDRIIQILEENYGVNQDAARAIAFCQSNVDYTRYLTALIEGTGVSVAGSQGGSEGGLALPDEELKDVLPAEEELDQPGFAD